MRNELKQMHKFLNIKSSRVFYAYLSGYCIHRCIYWIYSAMLENFKGGGSVPTQNKERKTNLFWVLGVAKVRIASINTTWY